MGFIHFTRAETHEFLQPVVRHVRTGARMAVFCIILLATSFVFCLYISRYPDFVNLQMNADSLLAVSFIWDLRQHDHALFGFQLPRIPSIFPDLTIQAAALAVSPTFLWSLFVYAWAQIVLFVLAAGCIAALLTARPYYQCVAVSAVLIAVVVIADTVLPGRTGITFNYFISCIHFGPFLTSLLASAVAWKLLQDWRHSWAALLFGLATLSILSNRLLLVAFAVPVALAAVLLSGRIGNVYRLVALIAASVLAAHLLDTQINRQPNIAIELSMAPARLQLFLTDSLAFIGGHLWVVTLCVFVPMAVFGIYFLSLVPSIRALLRGEARSETEMAKVFFWLQAAAAVAAVVSAVALLAYVDHGSYRYLAPVMVWPIVFVIAAVLSNALARRTAYALGVGIIALCAGDMVQRGDVTPGTVSWQSPVADCILANRERFKLRAGIAEYWISRPTMLGSSWTLQVNQSTGDGHPYIWGNNRYWYIKAFDNPNVVPTYNFVVMDRMDPEGVTRRFGDPTERISCPSGEEIWVYADGKRMTERFLEALLPPIGSYPASCADVMQIGSRKSGRCLQSDGTWKWTRIK